MLAELLPVMCKLFLALHQTNVCWPSCGGVAPRALSVAASEDLMNPAWPLPLLPACQNCQFIVPLCTQLDPDPDQAADRLDNSLREAQAYAVFKSWAGPCQLTEAAALDEAQTLQHQTMWPRTPTKSQKQCAHLSIPTIPQQCAHQQL